MHRTEEVSVWRYSFSRQPSPRPTDLVYPISIITRENRTREYNITTNILVLKGHDGHPRKSSATQVYDMGEELQTPYLMPGNNNGHRVVWQQRKLYFTHYKNHSSGTWKQLTLLHLLHASSAKLACMTKQSFKGQIYSWSVFLRKVILPYLFKTMQLNNEKTF